MNLRLFRQLLTARQRDLADNELDIEKVSAKLAALKAERATIKEDIDGLKLRIEENETQIYY
jgi:chromosome segregation ATPase